MRAVVLVGEERKEEEKMRRDVEYPLWNRPMVAVEMGCKTINPMPVGF